ncbi:sucrase ferredoxin [Streptomyces sp. NBC_01477]|uniref:sucrase ferredoxin n=1 Tax=Streptomyces sp. NBC_01477 TaxID=2976015 RepID=UPI002E32FB5D|nr:sucrase ferredoxin [Streptomyces sp. NBC_01477]
MSTCTTASAELGEPVGATAATARTWLLIEQPGPWGAKALTGSRLDPAVGRALDRASDGTGVRIALIRRPGRHADLHTPARHRVHIGHTAPGRGWVRSDTVADPAELVELDFAALGAGSHGGFGAAHAGPPLALVCTNGRRDRCCAVRGRPLAAELAASGGADTWEVTHLGGHRFSPTMLVLPYGYVYGRVDGRLAKDALEAARSGRIVLDGCRGRSTWDRPGQAADLAVRALAGEDLEDALTVRRTVAEPGGGWSVLVAHTDGRAWDVTVARTAAQPPRPESCDGPLGTPALLEATGITAVTGRS